MVRSMTGFGRGEAGNDAAIITVEARAVNHRHLDIALRLPRALAPCEPEARRLVQSRLERGRVDVSVQVTPAPGRPGLRVTADEALAREYLARGRELADGLGLAGEVPLTWVLKRPGVVRAEDPEPASPGVGWAELAAALGLALDELAARRAAEGERLAAELRLRHAELATTVDLIERRAPAALRRREERLRERMAALAAGAVDEHRILAEVAVWADRADVTEELVRLRAHLGELQLLLDKGGPVGRPLDFLVQELGREFNTVGAKSDDLELSQAVLAAKAVLEKIREQVQNIE